ncbi:MAG: hypothetical protein AMJ88_16785 [Anaerolineae bacterium SM23_ 63]|nr:MAG: hypothetical protein AMJ88_16785 [Anaerolineae bacterium SM23_ 63]
MTNFFDRLRMGLVAFKEAYLTSSVINTEDWSSIDARRLRYQVLWSWYEQTSYRDVNAWATAYRKQYALYKYVRPIYNPAWRLGEFWKAHLFGGLLDPSAGDTGAIPINTDNDRLREAIALLWKWSRWQIQKDILAVRGTILGDVAIQIVDDVNRGRVYLDLLYPGLLDEVEKDPFGNVKGYVITETRSDPRSETRNVTYTEKVSREGEFVVYETFLNGIPYAWPENVDRTGEPVSKWMEPYGFVPLVVIQHTDVGLDWGWSELHPIRAKVHEADDLASMISDQVRKTVDPIWMMKGMKKTSLTLTGASDDADTDRPAPGREELRAIWNVPVDGSADAMVANLDLNSALEHLNNLLKEIERDVVELSQDIHTASGDASGRALRTARQPVVSKVVQRRANYDAAMVAAQQMAIAIGGFRGYEGYEGFNLESYDKGDLEHNVADRPVFEEDALDQIEIDTAFWKAAEQAGKAGVPLEAYLREAGWDAERIQMLIKTEGEEQKDEPQEIMET